MQHLFLFVTAHYLLVGAFVGLLIAFIVVESLRAGRSISPQGLSALVNQQQAVVIDLRDPAEFRQGHITGSRNIPYARLSEQAAELPKDKPIILVCNLGQVAGTAGRQLREKGLQQVFRLDGGISGWKSLSLPLVKK